MTTFLLRIVRLTNAGPTSALNVTDLASHSPDFVALAHRSITLRPVYEFYTVLFEGTRR